MGVVLARRREQNGNCSAYEGKVVGGGAGNMIWRAESLR